MYSTSSFTFELQGQQVAHIIPEVNGNNAPGPPIGSRPEKSKRAPSVVLCQSRNVIEVSTTSTHESVPLEPQIGAVTGLSVALPTLDEGTVEMVSSSTRHREFRAPQQVPGSQWQGPSPTPHTSDRMKPWMLTLGITNHTSAFIDHIFTNPLALTCGPLSWDQLPCRVHLGSTPTILPNPSASGPNISATCVMNTKVHKREQTAGWACCTNTVV